MGCVEPVSEAASEELFTLGATEVEPRLFLSGAPLAEDAYSKLGIDVVIRVSLPIEDEVENSPVDRFDFPFRDSFPVPKDIIRQALLRLVFEHKKGKRVLVHCSAGMSRSPTVVILYWMARDKITWEEGLARLREKRGVVLPSPELLTPDLRRHIVLSLG